MLNDGHDKERKREETRTNRAQTTEVVCALGLRHVHINWPWSGSVHVQLFWR